MKRLLLIFAAGAAAVLVIALLAIAWVRGARADRCAAELVARAHDRAYLAQVIKSPTLPEELASTHAVELAFVRPHESDTARVGLVVHTTSTATRASLLVLMLERGEGEGDACTFLRDYDDGAFQR